MSRSERLIGNANAAPALEVTYSVTLISTTPADPAPHPRAPAPGCNCVSALRISLRSRQSTFWPKNFAPQSFSCAPNTPAPGECRSCLCFDVPHNVRHRIFRRYRNHHMHMVGHQMPFFYPTLFVLRQSPRNTSPRCARNCPYSTFLRPPFGYENTMWYLLSSHFVWFRLSFLSIWFLPFICLTARDRIFLQWTTIPTHTSNYN